MACRDHNWWIHGAPLTLLTVTKTQKQPAFCLLRNNPHFKLTCCVLRATMFYLHFHLRVTKKRVFDIYRSHTSPCNCTALKKKQKNPKTKRVLFLRTLCVSLTVSHVPPGENTTCLQFNRFCFIFNSKLFIFYWSTYFMIWKNRGQRGDHVWPVRPFVVINTNKYS